MSRRLTLPHSHSDYRITVTTEQAGHDVIVTITDKRTEIVALRYGLGTSDLDVPYAEDVLS
tara:strand:+ start:6251 stop:6433 length:183 start_codon:yes stop_codon:yes gene_type:complete